MKNLKITLAGMLAILLVTFTSEAQAQTESKILSLTEITIKQGHRTQFLEAVKQWKECYIEKNGADKWGFWQQFQGSGNVYVLSGYNNTFAELDTDDPAGKACRDIVRDFIMPHVEKTNYTISKTIPEVSNSTNKEGTVIYVNFYRVKNGLAFFDLIKETAAIVKEIEGQPRAYWYSSVGGSPESADYFSVTTFKDFAEMDVKKEGVWKMIERVKGKKKSDQLLNSGVSLIENSWSYIYVWNEELSRN